MLCFLLQGEEVEVEVAALEEQAAVVQVLLYLPAPQVAEELKKEGLVEVEDVVEEQEEIIMKMRMSDISTLTAIQIEGKLRLQLLVCIELVYHFIY